MAEFDSQGADVNARILYWGVEGAGKNTNLETIYAKLRPDHRGELEHVPTRLDPTVSYSVMPIELGQIGGLRTRIQVSTVPGGPEHAPTRKQLLDQVDGIVFVVDTTRERLDENLASFEELRAALLDYGRPLEQVPLVVQYNKRDESDPYALEELHRKLQMQGVAAFEAVASDGTAVLQTLTTISKRVIRHLRERAEHTGAPAPVAPPVAETPAPAPPAPPPFEIAPPPVPAAEATLAPATPAESVPLATSALEPELLGTAVEEDALLTAEAEAFFEPGFQQATAPEPTPSVAIADAGPATRTADGRVRLPVVLRDASGNEHTVTLSVAIEPPEPGSH